MGWEHQWERDKKIDGKSGFDSPYFGRWPVGRASGVMAVLEGEREKRKSGRGRDERDDEMI